MADEASTQSLIEDVFIESILDNCRVENVRHFQDDASSDYPIVSVKATLQEEDAARMVVQGETMEHHLVHIVVEYPVTAKDDEGAFISAAELNLITREIQTSIRAAGSTDAIEAFDYFEIEPLLDAEQDVEPDEEEKPTTRVSVATLEVIVLRG